MKKVIILPLFIVVIFLIAIGVLVLTNNQDQIATTVTGSEFITNSDNPTTITDPEILEFIENNSNFDSCQEQINICLGECSETISPEDTAGRNSCQLACASNCDL